MWGNDVARDKYAYFVISTKCGVAARMEKSISKVKYAFGM